MIIMRSNEKWSKYGDTQRWWKEQYSNIDMPTIFLAGPSPRDKETSSWRGEALSILEDDLYFNGLVFVPEPWNETYDGQIQWEWNALYFSDVVVFWVPRDLEKLPGFTTNVEFGAFVLPQKVGEAQGVIYGRPDGTPKTGYLDWHYRRVSKSAPYNDLRSMLTATMDRLVMMDRDINNEGE